MLLIADMASLRPEKVVKQVMVARRRREVEIKLARQQAVAELRSELKSDVTGLLLTSELVLKEPGLTAAAGEKLHLMQEITRRLRERLSGAC